MATETAQDHDNTKLFKDIDAYPWDTDKEFQSGLTAILGPKSGSSPSQTQELTLRARLFYYARKKSIPPIDFDAFKAYHSSKPAPSTEPKPPYPTPFAEIVELITSGKPIPGIKEIAPTVLSDKATKSAASKRRKPWEKEEDPVVELRTFGDDIIAQDEPDEKEN